MERYSPMAHPRKTRLTVSILLLTAIGLAQEAPQPRFEVASVRQSDVTAGSWCRFLPGGRLDALSWIRQLIQIAYGVEDYQVTGGPAWLGTQWYEIQAKAPNPDADKAEMSLMLQNLLSDRFRLQFRRDTVEIPVFALVLDKGDKGEFKLKPLAEGEPSHCGRDNSFVCGIRTTADLARSLKYIVGRPVFDQTNVDGRYDILLDFDVYAILNRMPPPDWNKPSLEAALAEQLGLKLVPQKVTLPRIVVESIQRPTDN
jgi:uncharacterized protein (TIGR03435 family)